MTKAELIEAIKALLELNKSVNIQFHGRPDCKCCGLAEGIESLLEVDSRDDTKDD